MISTSLASFGAKRELEFEQTTQTPVEKGQQGELMGLGLHGRKLRHPTNESEHSG